MRIFFFLFLFHTSWRQRSNEDYKIRKRDAAHPFPSSRQSPRVGARSFIIERAFHACVRRLGKGGWRERDFSRSLPSPSPSRRDVASRRNAFDEWKRTSPPLLRYYYFPDPIDRRGVFQAENYAIKQARIVRELRQRPLLATTMRTRNNRV